MAERMKPVEFAKTMNIRPQIVYGLIKRGKIHTYENPGGGPDLIDPGEARIIVSRMHTRGPRKAKASQKGSSPVRRGQIVSHDRYPVKGAFARPDGGGKSVRVVTDPGRGEGSIVWLSDGTIDTFWGTESLAQKLQSHSAQIEHPDALLGMIAFQWRQSEETKELADKLETWAEAEGIPYKAIHVGSARPSEEDEEQEGGPEGPPPDTDPRA